MWKKAVLIMVALLVVSLAACAKPAPAPAPAPAPKPAPVTTLIHSAYSNEINSESRFDKWYLEEISRRSGGLVKFQFNFGGALTAGKETLPAVRSGAVDLSTPPPAYFGSEEPLHNLFNSARIVTSAEISQQGLLDLEFGTGEISQILLEESRANNIKYLMWHPIEYFIMTKTKVEKLSDLKGLKIRSVGIYEPPTLQAFGAIPVTAMWPEIYESIARGTLDGAPTPSDWMVPYKIHEAAKYSSFSAGAIGSSPLVINLDSWNKLPDSVKAIMDDPIFREEAHEKLMGMWKTQVADDRKTAENAGVTYVTVDPAEQEKLWNEFKKVTLNVFPAELAKLGKQQEALKLLDTWLKIASGKDLKYWDGKFGITR